MAFAMAETLPAQQDDKDRIKIKYEKEYMVIVGGYIRSDICFLRSIRCT